MDATTREGAESHRSSQDTGGGVGRDGEVAAGTHTRSWWGRWAELLGKMVINSSKKKINK